ncbi:MAG: UDP-N-acetylglucosamine--LPS N-acetylglucosamine transferase [Cyanobacteria bacterium J06638_28]
MGIQNPHSSGQKPWLIYALGGGWGHLNRAIALARKAPHPVEILVNSPYATVVGAALPPHLTLRRLPGEISSREAVLTYVQNWLADTPADRLIVDTFPRGLLGELTQILPSFRQPPILIHRDLNPHYIAVKQVADFVQQHYDLVLIPGETSVPLQHLPHACSTAPWLLRDADELVTVREPLRDRLQLPTDQPLIMVCATGRPDELAMFGKLTQVFSHQYRTCTVRCLASQLPPSCPPELWITHWPGIEVLQFADIVIGGAGYNLSYECAALKIPLIALPLRRQYDRQIHRAMQLSTPVHNAEECMTAVARRLEYGTCKPLQFAYINGVYAACQSIDAIVSPRQLGHLQAIAAHHLVSRT